MPIDSQVVNGRIIGPDGAMPSSLEIDDGRIVSVDTETEVWRTVDASGYFVLPGAVQPGDPTSESAAAAASQGISTAIVPLDGVVEALAGAIEHLSRESVLDFLVRWSLPDDVTASDVTAARDLGTNAYYASSQVRPSSGIVDALGGATLRLWASSGHVDEWVSVSNEIDMILAIRSADELPRARAKKERATATVYLEIGVDMLDTGAGEVRNAVTNGDVDIITSVTSGPPLLQSAYRVLVDQWRLSVPRMVELCSTTPAAACRIGSSKGKLEPASDADFVVFDPAQESEIDGVTVQGKVVYGQLRGDILLFNDELHVAPGNGRMVARSER